MNTRTLTRAFATFTVAVLAFFALGPAQGAPFDTITLDDSATYGMPRTWSAGGNTITHAQLGGTFDPSNSDKLIVALGYRASGTPGYTGVTYNGVAMTEAVQHFNSTDNRQTTGIFYLDNPGAAGDLVISTAGNGFGFAVSLLAVSGTAAGVGDTSSAQAYTTSLTVGGNSLVLAQNAVSGTTIPAAQSPLVQLLSHATTGDNSSSHSSGYVIDPGAGTFFPTFSTEGANPSISAAEFTAAIIPEPSTLILAGLGLAGLTLRRRRSA